LTIQVDGRDVPITEPLPVQVAYADTVIDLRSDLTGGLILGLGVGLCSGEGQINEVRVTSRIVLAAHTLRFIEDALARARNPEAKKAAN
jgi:hypothetical protein